MLPIMLEDSIRLSMTRDRTEIKKILSQLSKLIQPCKYGEWIALKKGAKFRFQPAGHILGSAYVEIDHNDERFVLSGDLGAHCTPIMKTPVSPERADFLVLESTYGIVCTKVEISELKRLKKSFARRWRTMASRLFLHSVWVELKRYCSN
jgi:metallo-beta-lactamase family protein